MLSDIDASVIGRETRRYANMVYIGFPTPVRLWDGDGRKTMPDDDDLDPGGVYRHSDAIQSLPELSRMYDGTSQTVEFRLNVLNNIILDLYSNDVRGCPVVVGKLFFDRDWQQMAPVRWYWFGTLGSPRLINSDSERTLILTATAGFTDRRAKGNNAWSNAGHQSRRPGDLFFANVGLYGPNSTRKWPAND